MPRKDYLTETPTVVMSQFQPGAKSGNVRHPLDLLAKSYIVAVTGPRGSMKSGSLAYLNIWAMARGARAVSNLPTKCHLVYPDGSKKTVQTEDLNLETVIMNPQSLEGCLITWDEYQLWDRSGSHLTTQHKLLLASWEQIRKFEISFVYAAKWINLVPGDVARETDIEIRCSDISRETEREGTKCVWVITDLSGLWTRKMFHPIYNPKTYRKGFYHRAIMGAYDTRLRFDPLEAGRGFSLELSKKVITDKDEQSDQFVDEERYEAIKKQVGDMLLNEDKIRRNDLFNILGISNAKVRSYVGMRLRQDLGIKEITRAGLQWFAVSGEREKELVLT